MAFQSCAEWLWSGWPARFPELKIAMSEGGIAWVAGLIDRLDNIMARSGYGSGWQDKKIGPSDCLRRNFWFCMIDDPSTISTRHAIGVENILFESDYPHGDAKFPRMLDIFLEQKFSEEFKRKVLWDNCARLYGFE